jgi:hypothetical protein
VTLLAVVGETLHTGHGNGALGAALYLARKHSDKTLRELRGLAGGMQYPALKVEFCYPAKKPNLTLKSTTVAIRQGLNVRSNSLHRNRSHVRSIRRIALLRLQSWQC